MLFRSKAGKRPSAAAPAPAPAPAPPRSPFPPPSSAPVPSTSGRRAPAWVDAEEAAIEIHVARTARTRKLRHTLEEDTLDGGEYVQRLREQHARMNPRVGWAEVGGRRSAGGMEDDGEAGGGGDGNGKGSSASALSAPLRSAAPLSTSSGHRSGPLTAGHVEVTRLRDANASDPSQSAVRSLQFHPNGTLLLAAGLDKTLRFFQVDGARNPKLQGVHLEDLPVTRAAFVAGGSAVVAAGRRKFFYRYDLAASRVERICDLQGVPDKSLESFAEAPPGCGPAAGAEGLLAFLGDMGNIHLVSLASRQWVGRLKVNGSVRCAAFTPDGVGLVAGGGDGKVYQFDLRTRNCVGCR